MFKLGLKLWSINENYIKEAIRLYEEGIYSYIELYIVPGSFDNYINLWKSFKIPFSLHAPHYMNGMNLADKSNLVKNLELTAEVQKFADELKAEYIIFHPGMEGDIEETVRQLNIINDHRIFIENKPYIAPLKQNFICNGNSPEEINYILNNTNVKFCLDVGHAICAANSYEKDPLDFLNEFINLNPAMYHLSDGEMNSKIDKHLNFGQGDFDIEKILNFLPENARITLETNKNPEKNLEDFVEDIQYITKYK